MSTTKKTAEDDTSTEHESPVGQDIARLEDYEILTGKAEFSQDRMPDDALHLAFARSEQAHARIVDIDTSAAETHPECALVFTAEDLREKYNPMPCGIEAYEEWALAHEKVRFAGEPVAAVVSTDRYVAEDLTELVDIEYEPLPAVIDPHESITDEVILHEEVGTNIADSECLEFGPVDESLEQADNVITGEFSYGRVSGNPIETSGVLAEYDPDSNTFDIFSNLQVHTLVADQVYEPLGYDKEDVRLRTPDHIGGSYGTKSSIHRYCCLAAMASQFLDGTPIKFTEGRKEYLEGGDVHSSEREYEVKLGIDNDGTIRALDVWFVENFGAFPRHPAVEQVLKPLSCVTNSYDIDTVRYDYRVALTNKTAQAPYRGFGVPPHIYAVESIIDLAAREIGLDAAEIRRKNTIRPEQMPYQTPSKNVYDSGDYPAALDRMESILDESERCEGGLLDPDIVEEKRTEGKYRGVQPTTTIEVGGSFAGWSQRQHTPDEVIEAMTRDDARGLPENLFVLIDDDGTIQAKLATNTTGQGHQTVLTQLLSDELGVRMSRIDVSFMHSGEAPKDYGAAGSRMAIMISGAAAVAGDTLRSNLRELAAAEWGCEISETRYREGTVEHTHDNRALDLAELQSIDADDHDSSHTSVHAVYEHPVLQNEEFDEALEDMLPAYASAGFAVNAPIVEVDAKTGKIDVLKFYTIRDCGNMLNPTIVAGQAHGGIIQGMGASLQEEFVYNDDGRMMSDSMFEYLVPTIRDVPEIELHHSETPGAFTERGVKGVGEGGMIDVPAAIAASVNCALEPIGVIVDQLPFTANRAYHRIQDATDVS